MLIASSSAAAAGGLATLAGAGILVVLVWFVIGVLLFLFPFIVMIQLSGINRRLDLLKKIQTQSMEQASVESGMFIKTQTEIYKELKAHGTLTRQLLRAYGHEPEV